MSSDFSAMNRAAAHFESGAALSKELCSGSSVMKSAPSCACLPHFFPDVLKRQQSFYDWQQAQYNNIHYNNLINIMALYDSLYTITAYII